jgi:hypothetical protein
MEDNTIFGENIYPWARYRRGSTYHTLSHENKVNHPSSPTSDEVEVISPSTVISTLPRKGTRKNKNGRSSNKISISPLLSETDVTSQEDSFLLDSPDNECSDSPVRRIAGSLAVVSWVVIGSASWRHPLTPPGRTGSTWTKWRGIHCFLLKI